MSESETDMEFLDGLIGRPITVSDRVRLFALARRGVEAADRIAKLEAALRDLLRLVEEDPEEDDPSPYLFDQVCDRARAALGGENE
jgi:adenosine deaminase